MCIAFGNSLRKEQLSDFVVSPSQVWEQKLAFVKKLTSSWVVWFVSVTCKQRENRKEASDVMGLCHCLHLGWCTQLSSFPFIRE